MYKRKGIIYVGKYDELSPAHGYPAMKEHMEYHCYVLKDYIAAYLKKGKCMAASTSRSPRDVFTGKPLSVNKEILTDGTYAWPSELYYYVEKYNLRLPEEFEKHILSSMLE